MEELKYLTSVCNMQGIYFYWIMDKVLIETILGHWGSNKNN